MPRCTVRTAPVQARDVMTREVATVAPDTSVKAAAEILATRGFAAVPVVADDHRLVGTVTEPTRG
jgi:CBS domain-containing protein